MKTFSPGDECIYLREKARFHNHRCTVIKTIDSELTLVRFESGTTLRVRTKFLALRTEREEPGVTKLDRRPFYRYDDPMSGYNGQHCRILSFEGLFANVLFSDGNIFRVSRTSLTRLSPQREAPPAPTTPQPEAPAMSKIEITTVTFVNGTPLDDLSSESVEHLLAKTQARIDDITDRARSGAATNTMLAERDSLVTAQRALIELINRRDARPTLEERVAKLEEARS